MPQEQITPIYDGKPEDFRWAGFGSGSGTNLRECAKVIKPAVIVCDKPSAKLLNLPELNQEGVEHIVENGFKFCGSYKDAKGNPEALAEYERKSIDFNHLILQRLYEHEQEHGDLHLIVLGGYMRFVEQPLISAYPDKIINVHPANLGIRNDKGRVWVGEDAVYDAIGSPGTLFTNSSVILVDGKEKGPDHGEIITMGPSVEVWMGYRRASIDFQKEKRRDYADMHQDLQKEESDWPALTTALKMISEGRVGIGNEKVFENEWRRVYVDGEPMSYRGFQVKGE